MLFEESFTTDVFLRFLNRLLKGAKSKIFLILDNLRVHHAKLLNHGSKKIKTKLNCSTYLPIAQSLIRMSF